MAKAVIILPGTALVYVPLFLLWVSGDWPFGGALAATPILWLAAILALPAFLLARITMRLFMTIGEGTPAPWDPPQKFVVSGPYRYLRNPMLSSVLLLIGAEALAFNSLALWGWGAVFFVLNTVYFIRFEEPQLAGRFGADYLAYKAAVPRWLPRMTPYSPAD